MAIKADIGTKITLNSGEDISSKTVLKIKYTKPDGTDGEWDATVHDSNYARYITVDNMDLDQVGEWTFRIYVELPAWKGHGGKLVIPIND